DRADSDQRQLLRPRDRCHCKRRAGLGRPRSALPGHAAFRRAGTSFPRPGAERVSDAVHVRLARHATGTCAPRGTSFDALVETDARDRARRLTAQARRLAARPLRVNTLVLCLVPVPTALAA